MTLLKILNVLKVLQKFSCPYFVLKNVRYFLSSISRRVSSNLKLIDNAPEVLMLKIAYELN